MGPIQPWHIIVLVVIAFVLFGAKRLPDATRSVGQSLRIFKSEMRQAVDEAKDTEPEKGAVKEPEHERKA